MGLSAHVVGCRQHRAFGLHGFQRPAVPHGHFYGDNHAGRAVGQCAFECQRQQNRRQARRNEGSV